MLFVRYRTQSWETTQKVGMYILPDFNKQGTLNNRIKVLTQLLGDQLNQISQFARKYFKRTFIHTRGGKLNIFRPGWSL